MNQSPRSFASRHPIVTAVGVLFVLGLVVEYWWLIVLAAVIAAAIYGGNIAWRTRQRQAAAQAQARAELAARADREHQQYLAGEDRGLYGDYQPTPLD